MTFIADENSARSSRPVEVFDILAGSTHVRLCNQQVNVSHLGDSYTATPGLSRRRLLRQALGVGASEQEIVVPRSAISAFCPGPPPQPFNITITRIQPGGYQQIFDGGVMNNKISTGEKGPVVELLCMGKTEARLRRRFPGLVLAPTCQRTLYDKWCRIARADFDQSATIVDVDDLEVEVSTVGSQPDGWFTSGELWLGTEVRMITTQFGTSLTIDFPFTAELTGAVVLQAGCDKAVLTCRDKYANVRRFQGAAQWKDRNPHSIRLDNLNVTVS